MKIKQFRYGSDGNLGYLLWSGSEAAAIDGGAVDEILNFLANERLELKYLLNTHEHWDHIPGNEELLTKTDAVHIDPEAMCRIKVLKLEEEQIEAFPTPGHSENSIVYYYNDDASGAIITGDTLFNGTVGNCYTKEYEIYFESLRKILRFPPLTKIFAGHDIFDYAAGIIEKIDPGNPYLTEYKASEARKPFYTTIEQELKVNPFIRFNDPALDDYRSSLNMPLDTPYERWRAMMTVH